MDEALLRTRHHLHHIRTTRQPACFSLSRAEADRPTKEGYAMSVHIRPHYASIGVPQWRHNAAHVVVGQQLPDMSGVTITADRTDYDIYLPDSVWLTVMEDLQEHFARKKGQDHALVDLPRSELTFGFIGWLCRCGDTEFSFATRELATEGHAQHAKTRRAMEAVS